MSETEDMVERFFRYVDRRGADECWEWTGHKTTSQSGLSYGAFRVGQKMRKAHRVSYEIAKGPIPHGLVCRHKCDNPGCVNPNHLEPGTHKQNVADRYERGRDHHTPGSSHGNAKFSEEDVISIRCRVAAGEKQNAIAAEYGVSKFAVWYVLNRGWKHIAGEAA